MAGYKETPRQKMIGMMYLVLTALLALNVSKDILNAFVVVNTGLEKTTEILNRKNTLLINEFEQAKMLDEEKVGPNFELALKANKLAEEMLEYINDVKREVIAHTEFNDRNLVQAEYNHQTLVDGKREREKRTANIVDIPMEALTKMDNYEKPTQVMIGQPPVAPGKAPELKQRLIEFKANMLELVPEERREQVDLGFNDLEGDVYVRQANKYLDWETRTFYKNVLYANVVIFNRLITEVLNAQSEVITELMTDVDRGSFKFDVIEAKLVPASNIVMAGTPYTADIFMAAYSTTQTPEVFIKEGIENLAESDIGTATKLEGDSGVVRYSVNTAGSGERKYAGLVKVQNPDGTHTYHPFRGAYNVQPPSATVAADRMNVFYRGLDNPISVGVPGVPNDRVRINVPGCQLRSTGAGKYMVTPSGATPNRITVTVSAQVGDRTANMGSFEFRVENVPPPTPQIAGTESGKAVGKQVVINSPFVTGRLQDFLFEGVQWNIRSFTAMVSGGGGMGTPPVNNTGNRLNAQIIENIRRAPPGAILNIYQIRAQGPGGVERELPGINVILR